MYNGTTRGKIIANFYYAPLVTSAECPNLTRPSKYSVNIKRAPLGQGDRTATRVVPYGALHICEFILDLRDDSGESDTVACGCDESDAEEENCNSSDSPSSTPSDAPPRPRRE